VLSANVHNALKAEKRVTVELIIPAKILQLTPRTAGDAKPDSSGNVHLRSQALVPAGGTHRFDWPCKTLHAGVAALTVKALTDLEALAKRGRARETEKLGDRFYGGASAVFDSAELQRMVQAGLDRLYRFQHEDWGWGWWHNDASSEYMTAYVLMGLVAAEKAGFKVQEDVIRYGYWHLGSRVQKELLRRLDEVATESWETQAFVAYVMSLDTRHKPDRLNGFMSDPSFASIAGKHRAELVKHADRLGPYGKALLALACHNAGELEPARKVLHSLLANIARDDQKGTAWVRPASRQYWRWWNGDVEITAWTLRALLRVDPKNELPPRLVKWLVEERSGGQFWRSTRD